MFEKKLGDDAVDRNSLPLMEHLIVWISNICYLSIIPQNFERKPYLFVSRQFHNLFCVKMTTEDKIATQSLCVFQKQIPFIILRFNFEYLVPLSYCHYKRLLLQVNYFILNRLVCVPKRVDSNIKMILLASQHRYVGTHTLFDVQLAYKEVHTHTQKKDKANYCIICHVK